MNKILSICVPSYNMEHYLDRSIDSLLTDDIIDDIEIIIVNDGSKDSTLAIANTYRNKYPQSIIVIDKANGHYGSTVNAALKIAKGKYFRILDADDWFDTYALNRFISILKDISVDCVFTRFTTHNYARNKIIEQDSAGIIFNTELNMSEYIVPRQCYAMHSLTYRLQLLKDIKYTQTEGICYTDTEYVFYPLREAKTIYNIDLSLYQYYVGRDDQSMSHKVLSKNYTHFETILKRFIDNYISNGKSINVTNIQNFYIYNMMYWMLTINILFGKYNSLRDLNLRSEISRIETLSHDICTELLDTRYKGIKYVKLWYEHNIMQRVILFPIRLYFRYMK